MCFMQNENMRRGEREMTALQREADELKEGEGSVGSIVTKKGVALPEFKQNSQKIVMSIFKQL
eukprot:TRINITY_DN1642_c0_g1_i1.p1 TRINITY_DN1642_c0_g1~~TRINITY_DN1642_c0_g1_i1.p1  ORF type:complete len:63 (+),score=11.44 TRINITY_DN1642_c0_g1_i1:37-225(+)